MRRPFTGERGRNLLIGSVAGAIALAGLVIGNNYGNISPKKHTIDPVVIAAACAVGTLVFGVIATLRISRAFDLMVRQRGVPSAAVATRMFTAGLGYVITAFSVLAVLDVSIGKLLIGAGLAGVILGIAAQPSLGNVFSGVVLILTRPFSMGDHIRVRSGALGGLFDAWVVDVSLAYVTLRTDDGLLKVPNLTMLAAGVLQLGPGSAPLPAPAPAPVMPVVAPAAEGALGGGPTGAGSGGPATGAGAVAAAEGPAAEEPAGAAGAWSGGPAVDGQDRAAGDDDAPLEPDDPLAGGGGARTASPLPPPPPPLPPPPPPLPPLPPPPPGR